MRDIFADGVVNDRSWAIYKGDCLDVMKRMVEQGEKFDSIVTDPPYNLTSIVKRFGKTGSAPAQFGKDGAFSRASRGFMNCEWDSSIAFDPEVWRLALDLLKPGGYLLAFGGSRTFHRMVCAIEDAGFEIRDRIRFECSAYDKHAAFLESLSAEQYGALLELLNDVDGAGSEMAWSYGTGFPKSHDVSTAIDKHFGKKRTEIVGKSARHGGGIVGAGTSYELSPNVPDIFAPATPEAAKWEGWGSALKPAHEPICVARKPLEGTIAENVLKHGVGGMNIDGCRVEYEDTPNPASNPLYRVQNGYAIKTGSDSAGSSFSIKAEGGEVIANVAGRWPANIITDGSEEVLSCFPDAVGQIAKARNDAAEEDNNVFGKLKHTTKLPDPRNDTTTTAARFFYCAKANKEDRAGSKHPTVKPLKLLEYLCRLTCPPNGRILDMFAGSGSTLQAAINEGKNVVGIEKEDEYCVDIMMRMLALEAKS